MIVINFSNNMFIKNEETVWLINLINNYAFVENNTITIINNDIISRYIYDSINDRSKINFLKCDPIKYFDENHQDLEMIIIINDDILDKVNNSVWASKTYVYASDQNVESIENLTKYSEIWCNTCELCDFFVKKNMKNVINKPNKLYKFDFDSSQDESDVITFFCWNLVSNISEIDIILNTFTEINRHNKNTKLIIYSDEKIFCDCIDNVEIKYEFSYKDVCLNIYLSDYIITNNNAIPEYDLYEGLRYNYSINKKNYELINILSRNYDNDAINKWIEKSHINSFYNLSQFRFVKKYKKMYTIWLFTTPFSNSLVYSMQNLNYLGYEYKIVLNDNQINGLNYANNNTFTKYWFGYDDDFLMIEDSIEYMVKRKQQLYDNIAVIVFRLFDVHYGYKYKVPIDCYARYGIKLHQTTICKKFCYDTENNTDLFYKKISQQFEVVNYKDWENSGKIVGYHNLFCEDFNIFLMYLKMMYKYVQYEQDVQILWNYLISIGDSHEIVLTFLKDFNVKMSVGINNILIDDIFHQNKFENLSLKYTWLTQKNSWFNKSNNVDIQQIYNKLTYIDYIKISGMLLGMTRDYKYTTESYDDLKKIYNKLNFERPSETIMIINDINNIDNHSLKIYNDAKNKKNIKIYSHVSLISVCEKVNTADIINFPSVNDLIKYVNDKHNLNSRIYFVDKYKRIYYCH